METGTGVGKVKEEQVTLAADTWESFITGHVQWFEFLRFDCTGDPLWWIH
jgi:hypothetical protein